MVSTAPLCSSHRARLLAGLCNAQPVATLPLLHRQLRAPQRRQSPGQARGLRLRVHASSSLEADAQSLADKAEEALPIPNVCQDGRASKWDRNEKNFRTLLNKLYCSARKGVWVVVLGLFYCYNEAVGKLPWVRWHRFETWFWEKVRLRWLPAASAATVLARQYAKDLTSDMRGAPGRLLKNAWNAPGRLARRKDELEAEVKEEVEHAKEDLDEGLQKQREAVRKTVPDAVNPLLIGQNLRERLDEGLIDKQSFGTAMAELKQAVPFLKPGDSEAVRSELEMQSRDLEEGDPQPAPVAGFLNLPVAGSLGGERTSGGQQALSEAAEDVREHGSAGYKGISLGFLKHAPFWRGGKKEPSESGKQAAAEAEEKGQSAAAQEDGFGLALLKNAPFGIGKAAAEKAEACKAEQEAEESRGLSLGMLKGLFGGEGGQDGKGAAGAESTEQQAEEAGFSMDLNKLWPFNSSNSSNGEAVERQAAEQKQGEGSNERSGFLGLGQ